MTTPTLSSLPLSFSVQQILSQVSGIKNQATSALASLQAGSVNANFVFILVDNVRGMIAGIDQISGLNGLDARMSQEIPSYAGTFSTDLAATRAALVAILTWVTTNFPADAGGFVQAWTLQADGSRTPRSFTTVQTSGLQTAVQNLIATIS